MLRAACRSVFSSRRTRLSAARVGVVAVSQVIEDVVETEYVLLMVHSALSSKNTPSLSRLAHAIRVMPRMYGVAVACVVVRPCVMSRLPARVLQVPQEL
jgi:hypothetical protein